MEKNLSNQKRPKGLLCFAIVLLLLNAGVTLTGQTPTNFTGKWLYEKSKSTPDNHEPDWDGSIVLVITQTTSDFTLGEIYSHPERPDWETGTESYKLDGVEKITKHEIGENKNSAIWSADNKVLVISNTDTQELNGVMAEFKVVDTYTLSDDGKVLTIDRYRKNPVTGESK